MKKLLLITAIAAAEKLIIKGKSAELSDLLKAKKMKQYTLTVLFVYHLFNGQKKSV